jgi:hypothetical protein
MVDKNDALLREVDEELRREQLEKLWQKYGTYALVAAVLIVIGVGGTKWLEARRQAAAEAAGAAYHQAVASLAAGKGDDALKALGGIADNGPAGYAQLAKLQVAAAAAKAGKSAEALKSFEDIAKSSSSDTLIRGFAQLQAASLRMPEADFTEMQNRLNDLTVADGPWRAVAREMLGLAAMKAGKTADARRSFEQLLGERNVPASVLDRVRTYLGMLAAAELAAAPAGAEATAKDAGKAAPATK